MIRFFKHYFETDYGICEDVQDLIEQDVKELKTALAIKEFLKRLNFKRVQVADATFLPDRARAELLQDIDDKFDEVKFLCNEDELQTLGI